MVSGEPCYLLHNFIKLFSDYLEEEFIHLLVTKINKLMPRRGKIEFHIFIYMILSYLFVCVCIYMYVHSKEAKGFCRGRDGSQGKTVWS